MKKLLSVLLSLSVCFSLLNSCELLEIGESDLTEEDVVGTYMSETRLYYGKKLIVDGQRIIMMLYMKMVR